MDPAGAWGSASDPWGDSAKEPLNIAHELAPRNEAFKTDVLEVPSFNSVIEHYQPTEQGWSTHDNAGDFNAYFNQHEPQYHQDFPEQGYTEHAHGCPDLSHLDNFDTAEY